MFTLRFSKSTLTEYLDVAPRRESGILLLAVKVFAVERTTKAVGEKKTTSRGHHCRPIHPAFGAPPTPT